jgi:hypothetical protein
MAAMTVREESPRDNHGTCPARRFRYLIDIIVLAAAIVALEQAVGILYVPAGSGG